MNICKKIISTICASVFAFSCFGFNTFAEDTDDFVYPVLVEWEATSNTDGTSPITGTIHANIIISSDRHSVKLVTTEDFEVLFPIKLTNLNNFIYGKYDGFSKKYLSELITDRWQSAYKDNGKEYRYYYYDYHYDSYKADISGIKYIKTDTFDAGSCIESGTILFTVSPKGCIDYYMIDTKPEDEKDQYIKQLEEENSKLKTEIESYRKLDFDGDGLLTNADAQMILVYYTNSLVGKTTGKIEDYSEYVKQLSC